MSNTPVAQRTEHLLAEQESAGSNPAGRASGVLGDAASMEAHIASFLPETPLPLAVAIDPGKDDDTADPNPVRWHPRQHVAWKDLEVPEIRTPSLRSARHKARRRR